MGSVDARLQLIAIAVWASACNNHPCSGQPMAMSTSVAASASSFRVSIFDVTTCAAVAQSKASYSSTYSKSADLPLFVPQGTHVITIEALDSSQRIVASGCQSVSTKDGSARCLSIALTTVGDAGSPVDMACGGGDHATVDHCGSCVGCDTIHATGATCNVDPGGNYCGYAGCQTGFVDCDQARPNTNGCECEGDGCCGNMCQIKHSDGLSPPPMDLFFNCSERDLESSTAARTAAEHALPEAVASEMTLSCPGGDHAICLISDGKCACWGYGTSGRAGKVHRSSDTTCTCPNPNDNNAWF